MAEILSIRRKTPNNQSINQCSVSLADLYMLYKQISLTLNLRGGGGGGGGFHDKVNFNYR